VNDALLVGRCERVGNLLRNARVVSPPAVARARSRSASVSPSTSSMTRNVTGDELPGCDSASAPPARRGERC
jgi:hypothetical protein